MLSVDYTKDIARIGQHYDMKYDSYVLFRANQSRYDTQDIELINNKVQEYNELNDIEDFFSKHYAPPRRMYFTKENARRIDTIRCALEEECHILPKKVYFYLLANLLSAAKDVANTSSSSYSKKFNKKALNRLTLKYYRKDSSYYNSNHHIYETIATWDYPKIRGQAGKRRGDKK